MFARSEAIGVRSSWLASAISWRCADSEPSSASSVVLKLGASRASSSRPLDLQALGQVHLAGERLRAAGEANDRRERRARHQRAQQRRDRDPRQPDDQQDQQDAVELVIDLAERSRDHHRAGGVGADRQHPQVGALDGSVAQRAPAAARRDRFDRSRSAGSSATSPARRERRSCPCGEMNCTYPVAPPNLAG